MLETRRFDGKLLAWTRREIWKLTKPRLRLILLLTIMITTFTFTHSSLFSPVKATYIEGLITQDTIWTLTDSPFVVSKNVSVCQSATLTIEPGVEVRFGGDFVIVGLYAFLLYSLTPIQQDSNPVWYLWGFTIIFFMYILVGILRIREHQDRKASNIMRLALLFCLKNFTKVTSE